MTTAQAEHAAQLLDNQKRTMTVLTNFIKRRQEAIIGPQRERDLSAVSGLLDFDRHQLTDENAAALATIAQGALETRLAMLKKEMEAITFLFI